MGVASLPPRITDAMAISEGKFPACPSPTTRVSVMDEYLDASIGGNFRLLPDLLRSLLRERDQLQDQLSGATTVGDSSEWQHVVSDVRTTTDELERLKSSCLSLCGGGEEEEEEEGGRRELVLPDVEGRVHSVQPLVKEIIELEHLSAYLQWVRSIQRLSARAESQVCSGALSEAVGSYRQLSSLCASLEPSHCTHLRRIAMATKQHWRERLREKLSSDFSSILKELKWPFTSSLSSKALDAWDKQYKRFSELFRLLLQLQIDDEDPSSIPEVPTLGDPVLLPLELLLEPLRKRFRFHFSGERKTNSKEKPEWYFTQVSAWIRDHTHFLEHRIQPLLEDSPFSCVDARLEFTRGLLQEVESKLLQDLPEVVYHDLLMSHLVDELLLFERELRQVIGYPLPLPSCLHVLLEEVSLHKWLTLEKTFAVERLSGITSSLTAWEPAYGTMAGADDSRVPECTEGLMQLIAGITDRYRHLPGVAPRLSFLELQTDLLLEFHQDLAMAAEKASPLSPRFSAYLNASSYIVVILQEWGEQTFFLELRYHAESPKKEHLSTQSQQPDIRSLQLLRQQDPEFAASEGSAFDTVIAAFSSLVEDMKSNMVEFVTAAARTNCKKYRKEKWHSVVSQKGQVSLDFSPSASDLLSSLREQLQFIEDTVSPLLSPQLMEAICSQIDSALLSEVIMGTHFSEGGAAQLNHDVNKALVPLLAQFSDDITGMQLLERTQEACKLLQLLPGSAKLMQELLGGVVRGGAVDSEAYSAAVAALNDIGVHSLEPREAEQILRLKIIGLDQH